MAAFSSRHLRIILGLTAACYAVSVAFGFAYDDHEQIVSNPYLHWRYLPFFFQHNVWAQKTVVGNYYRPLFLTWLLTVRSLVGLHPALWHAVSIGLHAAVTWLVYRLALRITAKPPVSLATAALFGLHPVHVESVAWISGATDPLLALFFLGSFLCWLRYREQPSTRRLLLTTALFALALLAKETAIALPLVMLVYEWLYPAAAPRRSREALLWLAPFATVILLYVLARDYALRGLVHTEILPWRIAFFTVPAVLWHYLRLLVAPAGLSLYYDTRYVIGAAQFRYWYPLVMMGFASVAVIAAWRKSKSPAVMFGAAWFAATLLPALAILVMAQEDIIHDRYLYLPSIGFCLLVAMGLERLAQSRDGMIQVQRFAAMVVAIAALYAGLSVHQELFWYSDEALFRRAFQVAPYHPLSAQKYAKALEEQQQFEDAVAVYRVGLQAYPDSWPLIRGMAMASYQAGHFSTAETYMNLALRMVRTSDEYYVLGLAQEQQGKLAEAEESLVRAIRRNPQDPDNQQAMGVLLEKEGKPEKAKAAFREALRLNPLDARAARELKRLEKASH